MKLVYSPKYDIDIGSHIFPTAKYASVQKQLLETGGSKADIVEPQPASWEDLALVHAEDYLEKIQNESLSYAEIVQMEIPWSEAMVEGFRLMCGGTCLAARLAVEHGMAAHIGGGFHHAFADHGEGFCIFNDVAVAARVLLRDKVVRMVAIVDLDVHHGNGTAAIFSDDEGVFTFSMHQQNNYPAVKPRSDLDIGLPDETDDDMYMAELERGLPEVLAYTPDLIIYLAGADPYRLDQLGGLNLTIDGLRQRDRLVLETARSANIPVAITLAGGYAERFEDTVAIHLGTIEEAMKISV